MNRKRAGAPRRRFSFAHLESLEGRALLSVSAADTGASTVTPPPTDSTPTTAPAPGSGDSDGLSVPVVAAPPPMTDASGTGTSGGSGASSPSGSGSSAPDASSGNSGGSDPGAQTGSSFSNDPSSNSGSNAASSGTSGSQDGSSSATDPDGSSGPGGGPRNPSSPDYPLYIKGTAARGQYEAAKTKLDAASALVQQQKDNLAADQAAARQAFDTAARYGQDLKYYQGLGTPDGDYLASICQDLIDEALQEEAAKDNDVQIDLRFLALASDRLLNAQIQYDVAKAAYDALVEQWNQTHPDGGSRPF